jgi:RNA polymerase sigma factor (sigma-70 family)
MSESYSDRTFQAYYNDVGKHAVISAAEEYEYLLRYKTCPRCNKNLPKLVKQLFCPTCKKQVTENVIQGRPAICSKCTTRFDPFKPPSYCPWCGANRDLEAREKLLQANLRFVVKIAKKFAKTPQSIQRLISAGNVGLVLAIDKYDFKHGTRFLTYAAWWIRKEMWDELHKTSLVHIPLHRQRDKKSMPEYDSFESMVEQDLALHSLIPLDNTPSYASLASEEEVETRVIDSDSAELLRKIVNSLDLRPRDKFIILQHYDVAEATRRTEDKTLMQIASAAGITSERVRQIRDGVLVKLKAKLQKSCDISDISELC